MIKDKLQIFLITNNRESELRLTFEQIFADNSPIRDFDITIVNNASTDGTDDLIAEYQKKFQNLKHVRNPINIGGHANICRAYEMAATCGKEYAWVLCDDDLYNFENWKEVEINIENNKDIICVSDYGFPTQEYKTNKAYQILQLSFVPSCIFKTSNVTATIIFNMYESTFTMFPQTVLIADIINSEKEIAVLSFPVVHNGTFFNTKTHNLSFNRGFKKELMTERRKIRNWILGFSSIVTMLEDKEIAKDCIEFSIPCRDIYCSWGNFYKDLNKKYFNKDYFNYFYEIYKLLGFRRKLGFWMYLITKDIPVIGHLSGRLHNLSVVLVVRLHNILTGF